MNDSLGHLKEPLRQRLFATTLVDFISRAEEHFDSARQVIGEWHSTSNDAFTSLGLTDAAILKIRGKCLILTVDLRLTDFLFGAGVDFINFNHMRSQGW